MIVRHTGHLIEFCAREIPNSHNWAATVLVSWDNEGQRNIHEFHGPADGFATQKDSESWGIAFGTKWINDGKPILLPLRTSEIHILLLLHLHRSIGKRQTVRP